ncbi:MAG TPA: enolase C-terminal domain-like protein [Actinomycetota bacterium]|nr:enolase C-terminal domain-like protein [Actinomycetota bacterium]
MRGFRIPLAEPFRGQTHRTGFVVEGRTGWAECSPFPGHSDPVVCEGSARSVADESWPAPVRDRVAVCALVPACDPRRAARIVAESGCSGAKVKVGDPGSVARVAAVRGALGDDGKIRIDANGAWEVEKAAEMIRSLSAFNLEFVEQPVATLAGFARLKDLVDVPLAADELIVSPETFRHCARSGVVDVLVARVQHLGGVNAALELINAAGLPVVVSSLIETSIGLSAGVALAAAMPELHHASGLGTAAMLSGDIVDEPLLPSEGWLQVRRPEVNEEKLRYWEVASGVAT